MNWIMCPSVIFVNQLWFYGKNMDQVSQKWCFCTKSKGFTLGPPYAALSKFISREQWLTIGNNYLNEWRTNTLTHQGDWFSYQMNDNKLTEDYINLPKAILWYECRRIFRDRSPHAHRNWPLHNARRWGNPRHHEDIQLQSKITYHHEMRSLWVPWCISISEATTIPVGCCAIWNIRPKLTLNSNLAKSRSSIKSVSVVLWFRNFAHSTTVILPCSVQKCKTIGVLAHMLWTN